MAKRVSQILYFYGYVEEIDPWLEEMEAREDLRRTADHLARSRYDLETTISPISVPRRGRDDA